MKIAVSANENKDLESTISPHFGRCPYFVMINMDGETVASVETIANPYYSAHQPGQVPGFIHSQTVDVMLTGGMGGRAVAFFEQFGIQPVTGAMGTVQNTLEQFLSGALTGVAPCRESDNHQHGEGHKHA